MVRMGCKWGRIIFSLILTNFQPLLECESDDLPLTVHSHCLSLQSMDYKSDLFTFFYTVDWKQAVIIWVSFTESMHVLQYTENVSLKIVYHLAIK